MLQSNVFVVKSQLVDTLFFEEDADVGRGKSSLLGLTEENLFQWS